MFVKIIASVILVLGASQASIIPRNDKLTQDLQNQAVSGIGPRSDDVNAFLDEIFANLRYQMRQSGLTVINLPPVGFNFSETVMGVVYYGEASISNGELKGIDTIHRTGDSDLVVEDNGDIVITVDGGINDGTIGAALKVSFMGKDTVATVSGTLKDVRVRLVVRARISLDGVKLVLEELDIIHIGTISVSVRGLGLLDFLIKPVVQIVANLVKDTLASSLGGIIKDLLNSILQSLAPRFPIDEIIKGAHQASPYAKNIIPRALPKFL
ncbi:unnamed protein product [Allacma fusca]|uniref:Uncharacterized protein n=1 Tax=Allacma fusca TaxID=39272 RepID=A0A8J2LQ21_9HEXA|nr:unnamed protein product [Allacma fusca]